MPAQMQTHELGKREWDRGRAARALDQPVAALAPVLIRREGEAGLLENRQVPPHGAPAASHLPHQFMDGAPVPGGQDVQQLPLPDQLLTAGHGRSSLDQEHKRRMALIERCGTQSDSNHPPPLPWETTLPKPRPEGNKRTGTGSARVRGLRRVCLGPPDRPSGLGER